MHFNCDLREAKPLGLELNLTLKLIFSIAEQVSWPLETKARPSGFAAQLHKRNLIKLKGSARCREKGNRKCSVCYET
jgi:hypothetical protein